MNFIKNLFGNSEPAAENTSDAKYMLNKITHSFDRLALGATLILLFIVSFNILARLLHDLTGGSLNLMIPGAIELSRYALLFIVFSALPHASISGMVRVDLLSQRLPSRLARFLDRLWLLFMAAFSLVLSWLFMQKALLTFTRGDATQDLQMPLFYFYAWISIASAATTLSCVIKAFSNSESPD